MSQPLKLHSFLGKTTICRSAPPLGSNHLNTRGLQPTHHHLAPVIAPPYSPINAPPLDPNHPTTHHTFPQPHHSPHQAPTTHHLLAPINPPHLGHNHPSATTPMHQLTHHPPHLAPTHHLLAPITLALPTLALELELVLNIHCDM